MVDEARREVVSVAYGRWYRRLSDALISRQALVALAVGLLTLALLLFVFQRHPLARLPGYPAVVLAFLIAFVVPGAIVQRALLAGRDLDPLARLAVAPTLGLALAAVPGFIALELHLSLDDFALMHALVASAACAVAVLLYRDGGSSPEGPAAAGRGGLLVGAAVLVALGGVITTPFWAADRLAGDFDDWTYMAYVRHYLDTDRLNADEPFLGTGDPVNPRMRSNVWVLSQALVSDVAGVPPYDVLLEFLRPALTVGALLATYALTRSLFRNTTVALLAVAFQVGYALLDVSPHEGFGRNLFLRISEDKMVGAFLLFPVGLLFLSRFAAAPSIAAYVGFALVVLALAVVHPVPLVFLAIAIACFGALRARTERAWQPLGSAALLLVPVALASVWPFVQRQLLIDVAPELFDTDASAITFRDEFHVVDLGGGLLMGNYHMILHPLVVAAIGLAPAAWLLSRRSVGNQLVAAMTVGAVIVFFTPLLATPVAKLMTPQTLWKVPWMIPVGPVLAYVTYTAAARAGGARLLRPLTSGRRRLLVAGALVPAGAAALLLAAVLVVQEQYQRVDGGAFYDWTSGDTLVPGTEASVFRGGIDRAFSGSWRLKPHEERLMGYLNGLIARDSVVLVEPAFLNHQVPGMLTRVYPVDFGGTAGRGQRREDATAFARGELTSSALGVVVERYGVDYIVVREVGEANAAVETFPRARWITGVSAFAIYEIER